VIVIVEDDLVNCCKPGDDITINGLVLRQWKRPEPNMRCEIEIIMHANYIKINNQQQTHSVITEEKVKIWRKLKSKCI
jgi:DNA helicase MCM9